MSADQSNSSLRLNFGLELMRFGSSSFDGGIGSGGKYGYSAAKDYRIRSCVLCLDFTTGMKIRHLEQIRAQDVEMLYNKG